MTFTSILSRIVILFLLGFYLVWNLLAFIALLLHKATTMDELSLALFLCAPVVLLAMFRTSQEIEHEAEDE